MRKNEARKLLFNVGYLSNFVIVTCPRASTLKFYLSSLGIKYTKLLNNSLMIKI